MHSTAVAHALAARVSDVPLRPSQGIDATLDGRSSHCGLCLIEPMRRRTFFQLGLGSAIVLIGGGMALNWLRAGWAQGRFSPEARRVMRSVARAVLDGSLPTSPRQVELVLDEHLLRLEAAVAAFPVGTQADLSRLLSLLVSPSGRRWLAGLDLPWADASTTEIQSALQDMRTSSWTLRQQSYRALRDLTNAAYFADASAWPMLGYPGPKPL